MYSVPLKWIFLVESIILKTKLAMSITSPKKKFSRKMAIWADEGLLK